MVIDGNQATTMYQLLTVFTPTGEQIRTQLCDHITVNDDGLIVEMTEFVDTALVQRLVAAASHREKQPSEYYP